MKLKVAQAIKKNSIKVSLLTIISFLFTTNSVKAQASGPVWTITGNSNTIVDTNFLGTLDLRPLVFKTNALEWMRITPAGNVGIFTITPAYKLDVAGDINLTGALRIGTFEGTAGQVLTSAGGGTNTWTTPTNGTVTAVIGIAPIISSGGTAPDISITQAGISANGFLSSTDWNIFNNKVTGGGTVDYIPKWTPDGATLGNSSIFDNGNVSIGTTNPQAKLEVKNGSVLFDGTLDNNPPVNGPGTRMMWIPSKAAFRSGVVTSTTWDYTNVGTASTAFGYNTQANGDYSSAFGYGSIAQSYNSLVIGQYNIVSGTPGSWVATEPLFVIGNGIYNDGRFNGPKALTPISVTGIVRHNALTVLKNGNVGIGLATPKNKLDVQGGVSIGVSTLAPTNGAIIRGKVIIGQKKITSGIHTDFKLAVDGKAVFKSVFVTMSNWADYVFDSEYNLPTLSEVETFYKINKHLPEIPSEKEILENGIDIAEMNKLLLKKIEELTLYLVQQQKEIDFLKKKVK